MSAGLSTPGAHCRSMVPLRTCSATNRALMSTCRARLISDPGLVVQKTADRLSHLTTTLSCRMSSKFSSLARPEIQLATWAHGVRAMNSASQEDSVMVRDLEDRNEMAPPLSVTT